MFFHIVIFKYYILQYVFVFHMVYFVSMLVKKSRQSVRKGLYFENDAPPGHVLLTFHSLGLVELMSP